MTRLRYNGLRGTLGADLTSSGTTITFAAPLTHNGGTAVPTLAAGSYIALSILSSTSDLVELVYLTAYTAGATTGTILRGAESTTPAAHLTGAKFVHTATTLDFASEIDALATPPVLGRIDLVTAGQVAVTSKVDYLDCTVTISGVPGVPDWFGVCQVRGRGNSTWTYTKKPYKLKPPTAVSLMGMPAFNDWALLANAHESDPTMISNRLGFDIGRRASGLDWTPRSQYAELWFNGTYFGLYELTESVKLGASRVNAGAKATGTTGLGLTGAYLLEIDRRGYAAAEPGFETPQGVQIIFDDPSGSTPAQATYIETAIETFESALFDDTNWLDPTLGYAKYIDMDSFVDWYLVNELCSSQDSNFYSSCKLYKLRDTVSEVGKIFMGPLWDMNLSFGAGLGSQEFIHTPTGFYTLNYSDDVNPDGGAVWIERMFDDPAFMELLSERWLALLAALGNVDQLVDAVSARTASIGIKDQVAWAYDAPDWATTSADIKAWLHERIYWLSDQFIIPTAVPSQVTGLAGDANVVSMELTWNQIHMETVTGYTVQYRVAGDPTWLTFGTTSGNVPEETVTGLDPDVTYEFQVAAVNAVGTGAYSTTLTEATLPPGHVVFDDFDRADSSTSLGNAVTGQTWSVLAGQYGIASNKACLINIGEGNAICAIDAGISDAVFTIDMDHAGQGGDWQRIAFRIQDANNCWLMQTQGGGLNLYARVGGGFNGVASASSESGDLHTWEVTLDGPSIIIKQNGVTKFNVTDSRFQTETKFGFGGDSNPNYRWDNLIVDLLP